MQEHLNCLLIVGQSGNVRSELDRSKGRNYKKIVVEIKEVTGTQSDEFDLCESKSVRVGKCMGEERRTAYSRNLVKEVKSNLEYKFT